MAAEAGQAIDHLTGTKGGEPSVLDRPPVTTGLIQTARFYQEAIRNLKQIEHPSLSEKITQAETAHEVVLILQHAREDGASPKTVRKLERQGAAKIASLPEPGPLPDLLGGPPPAGEWAEHNPEPAPAWMPLTPQVRR